MIKTHFMIMREIACKLGVSAPESDEDIYDIYFLTSISRRIDKAFKGELSSNFTTYKTHPAESVSGIAQRQLGDEKLWVEIARLNSLEFQDVNAHDYYPVGTVLIIPNKN